MATVRERKTKDGHIRYHTQAVMTEDDGKRTTKCVVWQNLDNLTGVRAKNAAIAFGIDWERKLKNFEFDRPQVKPRRFADLAEEWAKMKETSKSHSYSKNIRNVIGFLNKSFGDKYMQQIRMEDTYAYFAKLNNATYGIAKARVKPKKYENFHKLILEYGHRRLREDIPVNTISNSWKGVVVELTTARMFCVRLGLDMNEYFDKLNTERRYCKVTINRHRKILSAIFNYAISLEQADHNYALPCHLKDKIGGEASKETKILTDVEMRRFEALLDTKSIFTAIPFYIMMFSGMRRAEMCGRHWEDIDFTNKVMHIKRDRIFVPYQGSVERETKNRYSVRKVPIIPKLFDKLVQLRAAVDYWIQNGTCTNVAYYADGTPQGTIALGRIFQRLLIEAGCTPIALHKLRHWLVTYLVTENAPVNEVARLVGHANTATTLKIYTMNKYSDEDMKNLMENIFSKSKGEKNEN